MAIPPPRIAPSDLPPAELPQSDTEIANTGARSIYLTPKAPCENINHNARKVLVGTTSRPPHQSSASCNLFHTNLPVTSGHIIPQFHHNLMGIGTLCDHDCRVIFEKKICYSLFSGRQRPLPQMVRAKGNKYVEIRPPPERTHRSPRRLLHSTNSTKRARPTQHSRPGSLLTRMCRLSCTLYLDCGHQVWQHLLLARPHLCKRDEILSCLDQVLEMTHASDQTRFTLHQVQTYPQGSAP